MTRKRYTPEQIIRKLREAEVMISQGKSISQATRQIGIVDQTYYKWRREYGGMRVDQAKRLKHLEKKAMRFRCKLISIDPLLRYKAKIELSLAILISV